jgi:hypothetical protein
VNDLPAQFELKPRYFFYGTIKVHPSFKTNTSGVHSPSISDISALVPDIIAIPKMETEVSKTAEAILTSQQNNPSSSVDATTGHFTLSLIAGQKYQIVINPSGQNGYPPKFMPAQISQDYRETITLKTEGSAVSGRVKMVTSSGSSNAFWVKIMQADRLVSSVGSLDQEGRFTVQLAHPLWSETKNVPLELIIEPNIKYTYLPSIREKIALKSEELIGKTIHLDSIILKGEGRILKKSFEVVSKDGAVIKDAKVIIKKDLDDQWIAQQLQTDDKGLVQTELMEGTYQLSVIAPQESLYGRIDDNKWEVVNSDSYTAILPERQEVVGHVLDYKSNPVEGVLIQLTRLNKDAHKNISNIPLRIEARSNQDGRWCFQMPGNKSETCTPLRLDEGSYQAFITPPPGAKLPHQVTTFEFTENKPVTITLHKPTEIKGRVISPEGPVNKAYIRIFSANSQLESSEPLLLGQAITNDRGDFSAFIYNGN